jgi:xanthine dehydrogenase YagS FAD-binding subunit
MRAFNFAQATTVDEAVAGGGAGSAYLAGGTTLVDLMKLDVLAPGRVVDINRLPLRGVQLDRRGLRIGALERMSAVATDRRVVGQYPAVAQALLASASPQIRNMASIGGNLLQRTRCGYFRDTATTCNRREPGSGCPAIEGENRTHAVLGTSDHCVATHPSDLAVALVAFDALVELTGRDGSRSVPLADFYRLPGDTPQVETELRPGELITGVTLPQAAAAQRSAYLKVRDRRSYEFALASAAVGVQLRGGVIQQVRVAVGGVATRPWRLPVVERALIGRPLREDVLTAAAAHATDGARPLAHNRFKVALVQRTVVRALLSLGE